MSVDLSDEEMIGYLMEKFGMMLKGSFDDRVGIHDRCRS
jgi:hypothetical protein